MKKYPVGIQSFESIRKDGYIYVDKTAYIYKMITEGKPYFLSRPRRFGKSLLVSTFAAVFEGRKELFEEMTLENGLVQPKLFIASTNWKWEKYDGSAESALEQISRLRYAEKYSLDGRPVTKVGLSFSSKERNIIDWKAQRVD